MEGGGLSASTLRGCTGPRSWLRGTKSEQGDAWRDGERDRERERNREREREKTSLKIVFLEFFSFMFFLQKRTVSVCVCRKSINDQGRGFFLFLRSLCVLLFSLSVFIYLSGWFIFRSEKWWRSCFLFFALRRGSRRKREPFGFFSSRKESQGVSDETAPFFLLNSLSTGPEASSRRPRRSPLRPRTTTSCPARSGSPAGGSRRRRAPGAGTRRRSHRAGPSRRRSAGGSRRTRPPRPSRRRRPCCRTSRRPVERRWRRDGERGGGGGEREEEEDAGGERW